MPSDGPPAQPTRAAPLVSVIIPCLNAGPRLRDTLTSVVEQTYPNLEVIFVDNNSTDASVETARAFAAAGARRFTVASCPRQGVNHARNLGYTLAKGDYIQWLDADDIIGREKVALQVAALEADPGSAIAYGDWTVHHFEPLAGRRVIHHRLDQVSDQLLPCLSGIWRPPHLYLLRRAAADRLQGEQAWWPDRSVGTDVEYFALAALLGMRFVHVPGAEVIYNVWSETQMGTKIGYERRVSALGAIYGRLRTLAASEACAAPLSRRHRILLEQNWRIWRLPPRSVTLERLAGRRFQLRRLSGDARPIELRPREAAIARVLIDESEPLASAHRALRLAEIVPEARGDHPFIIETLERFQREGILECVDPDKAAAG